MFLIFLYDFYPKINMGNMDFKVTYQLAHGPMKSMDLDYESYNLKFMHI
jgi:hypothetical protein